MNIDTIKHVLNNLKIILENKESIISHVNQGSKGIFISNLRTFVGHRIEFIFKYGLCCNAYLWDIDEYTYFSKNEQVKHPTDFSETLLDNLAYKFISSVCDNKFDDTHQKLRTRAFPIYDSVEKHTGSKKWLNPERWDYVEFLIDELTKIVDNENYVYVYMWVEFK